MSQPEETWKPIPSFESIYAASSLGRIMRIGRGAGGRAKAGKVLKATEDRQGYLRIKLCDNYATYPRKVHRLIAETFLGPLPEGLTVNHIDGDKSNNTVANLEVVSRGENISHAFRVLGSQNVSGSRNPRATLTEDQVIEIRRRLTLGESGTSLAAAFRTNKYVISDIKRRKRWKHI